jgi:purine-nucleoside phosphorylase
MNMLEKLENALQYIREKLPDTAPEVGIILGTGLGSLASSLEIKLTLPYDMIPGFSPSTVAGHSGNFIFGTLFNREVVIMQGRLHYYEGHSMQAITMPVRVMKLLGVTHLVVTNAAGGLNPAFERGDLMIIRDHINLFPDNPLIGKNDETLGPRFPDFSEPYETRMAEMTFDFAKKQGIGVHQGVYVGLSGPCLETPAEYRYLRIIGGDAVGMSTIPEVISAIHCGMTVSGISVITDLGVEGKIRKVSFEEIKAIADSCEPKVAELVKFIIKNQK